MKKTFSIIAACLTLSACATHYQPSARAGIACEGARCDRLWQRAQTWLATNSRYRIQIANDAIIQTYGPHAGDYDSVAYTVTKQQQPDGKTLISIYGACHEVVIGCPFDPTHATNRLYYELEATP